MENIEIGLYPGGSKNIKKHFKKKLQEQTLDVIFLPGKSVKIQTLFFVPFL